MPAFGQKYKHFLFFSGMMILFDDDGEEEWRTNEAVYDDIKDVDYDNRKQLLWYYIINDHDDGGGCADDDLPGVWLPIFASD